MSDATLIYFPVRESQIRSKKVVCNNPKYKYKRLFTTLDGLIRHLQMTQKRFSHYTVVDIKRIPIDNNRFNVEGEVSAILPFSFDINQVFPLKYEITAPKVNPINKSADNIWTVNLFCR